MGSQIPKTLRPANDDSIIKPSDNVPFTSILHRRLSGRDMPCGGISTVPAYVPHMFVMVYVAPAVRDSSDTFNRYELSKFANAFSPTYRIYSSHRHNHSKAIFPKIHASQMK